MNRISPEKIKLYEYNNCLWDEQNRCLGSISDFIRRTSESKIVYQKTSMSFVGMLVDDAILSSVPVLDQKS
jgi:hypothetical protein